MLSSNWVDILDLSLSAAFRREESIPRLAGIIAGARRASRKPTLVVVVGGRTFVEDSAVGAEVGADVSSPHDARYRPSDAESIQADGIVSPVVRAGRVR